MLIFINKIKLGGHERFQVVWFRHRRRKNFVLEFFWNTRPTALFSVGSAVKVP